MTSAARTLASLFLLTFVLSACHTAQKYVESGDYDSAIDFCVRKLRGKPKKNLEYVQGLELAFQKAQARDLATAERLAADGRPELWQHIHNLHLDIRARQNKVAPLTPLVAKNGYRAQFQFVDIAAMERHSREKVAEYLYNDAVALLERADRGDKLAARKAYDRLQDLEKYFANYRDKNELMAQARELGTSYVIFEIKNHSGQVLPIGFTDRIRDISQREVDSEWREVDLEERPGVKYDYKATFRIRDIDISPERAQERVYVDEKKIQDGWDYALDKRGNVMKDTAGNDVKKPRMVTIRAEVLEVHQTKAARVVGLLDVKDLNSKEILESREMATEVLFENWAATFRGDERALSQESKCRIGNHPLPFPRDEDMLVQAADRLKPDVAGELRNNRSIR